MISGEPKESANNRASPLNCDPVSQSRIARGVGREIRGWEQNREHARCLERLHMAMPSPDGGGCEAELHTAWGKPWHRGVRRPSWKQ